VPAEAIDAHRFERLVNQARTAAAGGELASALECFDEALRLWRGPALADVGETEWASAESARLEELRLGAVEDRLELLLEAGRHTEAVADLERLVTANLLRERLHRLLMLALYRTGRQAAALGAYQALRDHLAEELGIDPSPDLQALAGAILRQQVPARRPDRPAAAGHPDRPAAAGHPDRPAAASAGPSAEATPPVPRVEAPPDRPAGTRHGDRLPQRLSSVIGRQDDLATALQRLREARVVTLTGPGGVGKTTLALEVARRADEALADQVHLVRLAALEPGADIAEAFAAQLGLMANGPGTASAEAVIEHLARGRAPARRGQLRARHRRRGGPGGATGRVLP
jgi:tetratricopeptide (TPR) repeat protein